MRALQVSAYLPVRSLSAHPYLPPRPLPTASEYLISIHASGCNFFDVLQIRGQYQYQPPFPWISGSEFSGVVLSCPAGGGFATKICVEEKEIRRIPDGWSFRDAAGLFVTATTSYAALVTRARLKSGETVLVHAGAGGVGLAAIQIAKAMGARVVASAGSEEKRRVCARFGADKMVDYGKPDWGVDVVFDPVGMVNRSLSCTAWNGRVVVVGFAGGRIEEVKMNRVLLKNVSVVGIHWGMFEKHEPETVTSTWEGIFKLVEQGKFKGTVFSGEYRGLADVGRALQDLEKRKTWGKVVVDIPEEEERARL
ncbi:hypothetical protein BDD12DRAFT_840005 [Trichophaea hybrida]|nr:hypothetical protein BDD12DRAFT_840005 [Trichophaea hybrida]